MIEVQTPARKAADVRMTDERMDTTRVDHPFTIIWLHTLLLSSLSHKNQRNAKAAMIMSAANGRVIIEQTIPISATSSMLGALQKSSSLYPPSSTGLGRRHADDSRHRCRSSRYFHDQCSRAHSQYRGPLGVPPRLQHSCFLLYFRPRFRCAASFRQLIVLLGRVLNSPRGGEIWCSHVGTFKGMREDHQRLMQQRSKNCSSECEPDRFGEAPEMRFTQPSKAALICPPNFPAHGFVYVGIK